jgi:hypothetical protein
MGRIQQHRGVYPERVERVGAAPWINVSRTVERGVLCADLASCAL